MGIAGKRRHVEAADVAWVAVIAACARLGASKNSPSSDGYDLSTIEPLQFQHPQDQLKSALISHIEVLTNCPMNVFRC